MQKNVVTAITTALALSATLYGQTRGSQDLATAAEAAARVRKLKQQAIKIAARDYVRVELTDHTEVMGFLAGVSNDAVTVQPRTQWDRKSTDGLTRKRLPPQSVPFERVQRLERAQPPQTSQEGLGAFGAGVFCGLLGPLGWVYAWAMATDRD